MNVEKINLSNFLMGNKKAMSPLISTLILICFAIALGGVVMSWGKAGYTVEKPSGTCKQTSLGLINYGSNRGICSKDNTIHFTLQNNGEIGINGIKVSVLGSSGIRSQLIKENMPVADIKGLSMQYSGTAEKVVFVPIFTLLGQEKLCPKNGFTASQINEC